MDQLEFLPDRNVIKDFFRKLNNTGNIEGDQALVSIKNETAWVPANDLDQIADVVMDMGTKGDVYFNTSLHDKESVFAEYIARKPNMDPKYARGRNSTVTSTRGAFIDIDVAGPGHSQSSLPRSKEDAVKFVLGLPFNVTLIIDSGGGLHVHVLYNKPFDTKNDIDRQRSKNLNANIQKIVTDYGRGRGWSIDNVGDLARMARIPGTYNQKVKSLPRMVHILHYFEENRYDFEELERVVSEALEPDIKPKVLPISNDVLPDLNCISERCNWVKHTISDSESLPESEWFALTSISSRCENGQEITHEISEKYPRYSHSETEAKIAHALEGGPRTCSNIADLTGDIYCADCKYKEKITSPIQLGYSKGNAKESDEDLSVETLSIKSDSIIKSIKAGDLGAHMDKDSVKTFAALALASPAEYARKYHEIKDCQVQVQEFKKAVKTETKNMKSNRRQKATEIGTLTEFLNDSPFPELIVPQGYEVDFGGIWRIDFDHEGNPRKNNIALRPIIISKRYRDIDSGAEQVELSWKATSWHTKIINRDIISSTRKIVDLSADGLPIHTVNASDLIVYLAELESANYPILPCETTTSHLGWQGEKGKRGFLVGGELFTDDSEDSPNIKFTPISNGDTQIANAFRKEGDYELWKSGVKKISGYPVILAALYSSFAPVLLEVLGCSNYTYELACRTSKGKTTALRIAASVWGCPDERDSCSILQSWNNTKNFVERAASILNGLPLMLDDTKQCRNTELLSEIIYMVANGRGKGRADLKGLAFTKPIKTVLLSTAEVPSTHLTHDGGTKGRVLEVTVQPFSGNKASFVTDAAELVMDTNQLVKLNYGHAGPLFVDYVISNKGLWEEWKKQFRGKELEYAQISSGSEVAGRLAEYAGITYMAGKLAHESLSLPWDFEDPLKSLWPVITKESIDPTGDVNCLLQCFSWASAHKDDFAKNYEAGKQPSGGWAGKWDSGEDWEYLAFTTNILTKVIRDAGYDVEAILRGWLDRGWLSVNEKDTRHRYVKQVSISNSKTWMYVIKKTAFDEFNEETEVF